jgi:hypothetical protein
VNCESVRRHLIALERLDVPPAEVRKHLTVCAACRAWHAHAVGTERAAARLPAPAPRRKAEFLAQFIFDTQSVPAHAPAPGTLAFSRPIPGKREWAMRKAALAVALAASLLVVALGAWLWNSKTPGRNRTDPPGPNSLAKLSLEQRLETLPEWKAAATPQARTRVLGALADDYGNRAMAHAEAEAMDDLKAEVQLYQQVVEALTNKESGQLRKLPTEERRALLDPIARRLGETESRAKRLARTRPEASPYLLKLASAAAEGDRQLRKLL